MNSIFITRLKNREGIAKTLLAAATSCVQDGDEAVEHISSLIGSKGVSTLLRAYYVHQSEILALAEGHPPRQTAIKRLLELLAEGSNVSDLDRDLIQLAIHISEGADIGRWTIIPALQEIVTISPEIWPGKRRLRNQPGDLSVLASMGNRIYGLQQHTGDPFLDAPRQEAAGGSIYFGSKPQEETLRALFTLWDIRPNSTDYALFASQSGNPAEDNYLVQIRIVSRFALRFLFDAIISEQEYNLFPPQSLTIFELVQRFILLNQQEFGTSYGDPDLAGLFGGDGNFAKEELAFGFMLENSDYHIYRLWSRAWLVTK